MTYKIKEYDKFLCIQDYVMYDTEEAAYTEGKEYLSEAEDCITDNETDVYHQMDGQDDFFEHFKFIGNVGGCH